MAPRKRGEVPKFEGELAEPIVIELELPEFASDWKPRSDFGFIKQMEKLAILREHYNIEKGDWLSLSFRLALDFVPGFEVVYDDPLAAAMGLPVRAKAVRSGKGSAPHLWGPRLLAFVDLMKRAGEGKIFTSDKQCAEFIFEIAWPKPERRLRPDDRKAGIATIERRIREARRHRDGPARIVRGKSKLN